MIRVRRATKPDVLERKAAEWLAAYRTARTPKAKKRALGKYRHREVRDTLGAMFNGKCAYCESAIEHVDYPDIEHYRPKSKFPDLTFQWDNMLLACTKCNSKHKRDAFPEADDGGPIINPCDEDPGDHLVFDYNPIAQLASVYERTTRGSTTIALLGLNRPALRAERSRQVARVAVLARFAREGDAEAAQLLHEARTDAAPYAAFARSLVAP